MKNHFQKLFKLLKTHKKASIKVGFLVSFHSAAFMAVPYLFKGSQMISHIENKKKKEISKTKKEKKNGDEPLIEDLKKRFNALSLEKKYLIFYGGCLTYLFFMGLLTKVRYVQSRKLEDLFSISMRKKIFTLLFQNRRTNLNTSVVVQKTMNDVNLITTSLAMSFINILRGMVFGVGGMSAIAFYFPEIGILTVVYLSIFALRTKFYFNKIQIASKTQIDYLEKISKELGQFSGYRKSIFLSDAKNFSFNFFSLKLYNNHEKLMNLAELRGKHFFFLETFGIGYILSIICYGTYLISIGSIMAEDLALSIFALYAAIGIRSINNGISELKEKHGILESMENYFKADLTSNIEDFEKKKKKENILYNSTKKSNFFLSEKFVHYLKFEEYVLKNFNTLDSIDINKNHDLQILSLKVKKFLQEQRNNTKIYIKNLKINEYLEDKENKEVIINELTLKPGICMGIKGRSGIGKTSLVDMINDFREIDKGNIQFEKKNPNKKTRYFYFTQVPQIFERNFIFNMIISNIELVEYVFNLKNFTDEQKFNILFLEIKRVLEKSKVWYKIEKNHAPNYLNSLSAGEKQKLIFGRLFFSNSDVIFMDESISNLDEISKNLILYELKDYLQNRTSLFISHNNESLISLCGENIIEIKR